MGTMAHSWVMSFPDEREAFDAYASIYPEKTLTSSIPTIRSRAA
jgi:nicotinate phosphoribosyltransferase